MKYPNGSESVLSPGPWAQLTKVLNCPCEDGVKRTVHNIGIPDTFFSAPGRVYAKGKTVAGFITCDEDGYRFVAYKYRKNWKFVQPK